ncbi:hypothetical protein QTP88_002557 [Uroleucon formosanum]
MVHGDRLGKIQPLVVKLVNNFKKYKVPGENVVIDETMISFRGRLNFRQYIPSKSARHFKKNSKGFPKDIMNPKLKKGEIKGKEDGKGVVVSIWKNKWDVRMLSTRHGIEMVDMGRISRNGENIKKPEAIVFYNKNKQGIDVSDQMNSYFTPLRKSIRWYHKVVFQLLLGTSVVNALVMYKELTGKSIQISQFRQQIIEKLIKKKDEITISSSSIKHKLVQTNETKGQSNKKKKKMC